MDMTYLIPIISFFVCLAATPLIRFIAARKGWMAYPVKERWHKKPTALLGGVAIYLGVAIPLFFMADFSTIFSFFVNSSNNLLPSVIAVIWVGITLLFFLGLIDDFIKIKPQTKLVGQILVASHCDCF